MRCDIWAWSTSQSVDLLSSLRRKGMPAENWTMAVHLTDLRFWYFWPIHEVGLDTWRSYQEFNFNDPLNRKNIGLLNRNKAIKEE
jgi:hypothetical protein